MIIMSWSIERWREVFDLIGTPGALLFTGVALYIDTRVRHAETNLEITKQHRELWMYFDEHPELDPLFDNDRNAQTHPPSEKETRFANFLFLHLRAAYGAQKARIFSLPEQTMRDWKDILSNPAMLAAWDMAKQFHDKKFVRLMEKCRPKDEI